MAAARAGATTAALAARKRSGRRTDAMVAMTSLAAVLVAGTALVATGTTEQFLTWAWERHADVRSWYIRPLFVLPLALFSYRRSLAGIVLTLIAVATSIFWFPTPARVDPPIAEFLAFERQWLTSGWTADTIAQALLTPVALFALCLAFWKRSLVLGLVVINAMALGKVAWGVIEGGGTGWAMQVPVVVGLAVCGAAVLYALTQLRKRAARTHDPAPRVPGRGPAGAPTGHGPASGRRPTAGTMTALPAVPTRDTARDPETRPRSDARAQRGRLR